MSKPRDIMLHLGAHKTASTHLQHVLRERAIDLQTCGTLYLGPQVFRRSEFTVRKVLETAARLKVSLTEDQLALENTSRILISEENQLGEQWTKWGLRQSHKFYPDAAKNLTKLAEVKGDNRLHLALAVRDPATFIKSAYTHALMVGTVGRWDKFVKNADPRTYRWSTLVQELHGLNLFETITLWRYEDYGSVVSQALNVLAGARRPSFKIDLSRRDNVGVSRATVDALEKLRGDGFMENYSLAARTEDPISADNPAFQPWSEGMLRESCAAYHADLAHLGNIQGITLLRTNVAKG